MAVLPLAFQLRAPEGTRPGESREEALEERHGLGRMGDLSDNLDI